MYPVDFASCFCHPTSALRLLFMKLITNRIIKVKIKQNKHVHAEMVASCCWVEPRSIQGRWRVGPHQGFKFFSSLHKPSLVRVLLSVDNIIHVTVRKCFLLKARRQFEESKQTSRKDSAPCVLLLFSCMLCNGCAVSCNGCAGSFPTKIEALSCFRIRREEPLGDP